MMHDDEVAIDLPTVRTLIHDQFPEWRGLEVEAVRSAGTVNAIFRIGSELAARFPLLGESAAAVETLLASESVAMSELAGRCPFPAPRPVAIGQPGQLYPFPWSVQTWLPGEVATPDGLAGSTPFALDLIALITALRATDTLGRTYSGAGRGGDLRGQDEWMARCFDESAGLLDVASLRALWERLRDLPISGPDVMSHGDLIPANLLVHDGRLVGVLDGGGFKPADPALDLVAAWHLLNGDTWAVVRDELGCEDVEWKRGAAWAFAQSMGLVWYYRSSNQGMAALGRSTLDRLLADREL